MGETTKYFEKPFNVTNDVLDIKNWDFTKDAAYLTINYKQSGIKFDNRSSDRFTNVLIHYHTLFS
jgi:hypothetical protein